MVGISILSHWGLVFSVFKLIRGSAMSDEFKKYLDVGLKGVLKDIKCNSLDLI